MSVRCIAPEIGECMVSEAQQRISHVWCVAQFQSPVSSESLWALTSEVQYKSVAGHGQPHPEGVCVLVNQHMCCYVYSNTNALLVSNNAR